MGWPRKAFLNAAVVAGTLLIASGASAYVAPEFYDGLSEQFDDATGQRPAGGRYAGLASSFTYFEPNTALMIGGALLAYGLLVPKDA